jgi:hypothetical protein
LAAAVGLAAAGTVSACANGTTPVAGTPVSPASSAASTSTGSPTPAGTPTAAALSSSPSAAPVTTGYDTARVQWKAGATGISAQQGLYWSKAAADFTSGESTDTGDTSGYPVAVTDLKELVTLPDGQQTPAQNAAYHNDINALNTFFNTTDTSQSMSLAASASACTPASMRVNVPSNAHRRKRV